MSSTGGVTEVSSCGAKVATGWAVAYGDFGEAEADARREVAGGSDGLGLDPETSQFLIAREHTRVNEFESYFASEQAITSPADDPHAATAKFPAGTTRTVPIAVAL